MTTQTSTQTQPHAQSRISRRDFFKLNAIVGGALAVTIALPAMAAAKSIAPTQVATEADVPHAPILRFGTPTDVAATWLGDAWSLDAQGNLHNFDRTSKRWHADADEGEDFPAGSTFVLTRWGRPSGPNQMLMVLGPVPASALGSSAAR